MWPDDALKSVAALTLQELTVDDALCEPLAQQCMRFHRAATELSHRCAARGAGLHALTANRGRAALRVLLR